MCKLRKRIRRLEDRNRKIIKRQIGISGVILDLHCLWTITAVFSFLTKITVKFGNKFAF